MGIGYTYLFAGVAIFVAIIFFILDLGINLLEKTESRYMKRVYQALLLIMGLYMLYSIGQFCLDTGQILISYGKEIEQKNQNIVVNLSCVDNNCTANVHNNLVISCPESNCPSPQICPTQTPLPKTTTPAPVVYRCPWSLSLP